MRDFAARRFSILSRLEGVACSLWLVVMQAYVCYMIGRDIHGLVKVVVAVESFVSRVEPVAAACRAVWTMPAYLYALFAYLAICFATCCTVEAALVHDLTWRVRLD